MARQARIDARGALHHIIKPVILSLDFLQGTSYSVAVRFSPRETIRERTVVRSGLVEFKRRMLPAASGRARAPASPSGSELAQGIIHQASQGTTRWFNSPPDD